MRRHHDVVQPCFPIGMPLRLLCADDEEDIRVILELALGLDGDIEAEVVESGQTLLARATRGGYDGFLLDGMMPGMDGYEVCRRLKGDARTAPVPVLFLTAKSHRDDTERALQLGALACLPKPFDPMTLANDIRRALGLSA